MLQRLTLSSQLKAIGANRSAKLGSAWLFMGEGGLLRTDTRLKESRLPEPIAVAAGHMIVEQWLRDWHEREGHIGASTLMAAVRGQFFVAGLRRVARKVVSSCRHCRKLFAKPLRPPLGDLPAERLDQ